jgi:hypothetical protein
MIRANATGTNGGATYPYIQSPFLQAFYGARNRFVVPTRQATSLAASIPRNRFLGSINDYKYGLRIKYQRKLLSSSILETSVMSIWSIILKGNCHFFSCFLLSCTMYIFILRGFQQLHIISCLIYESVTSGTGLNLMSECRCQTEAFD